MTHIVVIGAGLGGVPMACEMKDLMKSGEKITVISNSDTFHFVPSNPWVAVNWRTRDDIEVPMAPVFRKRGINFIASAATRVDPDNNRVELADGQVVDYDYLIVATGPELATVAIRNPFAMWTMPSPPARLGRRFVRIPSPSSWVRYRARHALAPLMNLP